MNKGQLKRSRRKTVVVFVLSFILTATLGLSTSMLIAYWVTLLERLP